MSEESKPRALITGASRGIGAAIAERLAQLGHPVILNFRSNEAAAAEVKGRIEAAGGSAQLAPFDVADRDATRTAIAALLEEGPIGVLVNNAGVVRDSPFPAMKDEDWDLVTQTSLTGFFNVTKPLVMPMVRKRWGRIITITSVSGVAGNRGQTNYSAAKAGLGAATQALSKELAKRNVTVNAVAPGFIATDMTAELPEEHVLPMIPMRRLGKPEEVAALVGFLVGDEAAYITGQIISINGGLL